MSNNILVVAAHADDEALGCGGTLAKHISEGDQVTVMFLTDGVSSRGSDDLEASKRSNASSEAMRALGIRNVQQFSFPDNKMDNVALLDVVKVIESVIAEVKPETVYTHFANDLNVDHQVTHKAVMTACRPQSWSSIRKILSFEVLSSTEWNSPSLSSFKPQYIVDISEYWEKKLEALKCYETEMRPFPHSRSNECIEALAILRGATNGLDKAEAFFIERYIC